MSYIGYREAKRSDIKWGATLYFYDRDKDVMQIVKVTKPTRHNIPAHVGESPHEHEQRVEELADSSLGKWKDRHAAYFVKGAAAKVPDAEKQALLEWLKERSDKIKISPIAKEIGFEDLWRAVKGKPAGANRKAPNLPDEAAQKLSKVIQRICKLPEIKMF